MAEKEEAFVSESVGSVLFESVKGIQQGFTSRLELVTRHLLSRRYDSLVLLLRT